MKLGRVFGGTFYKYKVDRYRDQTKQYSLNLDFILHRLESAIPVVSLQFPAYRDGCGDKSISFSDCISARTQLPQLNLQTCHS
ncbi:hypothetical protein BLNAU_8948 [Blattamonas nauphoetae]|uniref:Uncharacterized protein n=1 Tax=Blattamonas nauphoetae TaxID=2049346 RepID=A0ABQ9XXG7_9EUKA|nr:hypothetical protein BLNAU_8948 [Blattamonas nauphoetae]